MRKYYNELERQVNSIIFNRLQDEYDYFLDDETKLDTFFNEIAWFDDEIIKEDGFYYRITKQRITEKEL